MSSPSRSGAAGSRTRAAGSASRNPASRNSATVEAAGGSPDADPAQPSNARRASAAGEVGTLDRDGFLRLLFPSGIPPRADVLEAVNALLVQAEQVAMLGERA